MGTEYTPTYTPTERAVRTDRVYRLTLTVAGQTFTFEGPTFEDGLSTIFQAWLTAVGPTLEAQAFIDKATERLKASTDKLVDDVAASTPTTA